MRFLATIIFSTIIFSGVCHAQELWQSGYHPEQVGMNVKTWPLSCDAVQTGEAIDISESTSGQYIMRYGVTLPGATANKNQDTFNTEVLKSSDSTRQKFQAVLDKFGTSEASDLSMSQRNDVTSILIFRPSRGPLGLFDITCGSSVQFPDVQCKYVTHMPSMVVVFVKDQGAIGSSIVKESNVGAACTVKIQNLHFLNLPL